MGCSSGYSSSSGLYKHDQTVGSRNVTHGVCRPMKTPRLHAVAADGQSSSNVLFVRSDSFSDSDHPRRATLRTNDAVTENAQPENHSAFTRLEHDGGGTERSRREADIQRRLRAESAPRTCGVLPSSCV